MTDFPLIYTFVEVFIQCIYLRALFTWRRKFRPKSLSKNSRVASLTVFIIVVLLVQNESERFYDFQILSYLKLTGVMSWLSMPEIFWKLYFNVEAAGQLERQCTDITDQKLPSSRMQTAKKTTFKTLTAYFSTRKLTTPLKKEDKKLLLQERKP